MLKYGIVGWFEDDGEGNCPVEGRCVVWPVSAEWSVEVLQKEICWFTSKFNITGASNPIDALHYEFGGSEKRHTLAVGEEWFCYSFETGHLTRIPTMSAYKTFVKAF